MSAPTYRLVKGNAGLGYEVYDGQTLVLTTMNLGRALACLRMLKGRKVACV